MAGDYHRGEMDIQEQASTYEAFGAMTKWGLLAISVVLLMITLWFCTSIGFFGGVIAGFVPAVLGVVLLREKPASGH